MRGRLIKNGNDVYIRRSECIAVYYIIIILVPVKTECHTIVCSVANLDLNTVLPVAYF